MLLLIESGVVDKEQAVEAVTQVIDLKRDIAGQTESVVVSIASIALLKAVAQSLAVATGPKATATSRSATTADSL